MISGTPQVGDTLTASPGVWAGDTPMSFSYAWSDGATGQADKLSSGDAGQSIAVTVTATNDAGSAHATSLPVGPVQAAPPPPPPPPPGIGTGQSVGFWLAWVGGNVSQIPWNAVTQVDLFSLASCANTVTADCPTQSSLDTSFNGVSGVNVPQWVGTVHQNHRLAIISIGGSTNPNWAYPCSSANVAQFAQNLVNYMQSNGFDGIDLDIEQDTTTGSPQFTASELQACAQDVYNDAKAVKTTAGATPIVTSDVDPTTNFHIGQIEAPYVDQFNSMSYGHATNAQLQSDLNALQTNSGIPASKVTLGIDVGSATPTDCGNVANYASTHGTAGTMLWYLQGDTNYSCLSQIAPYVAPVH